MYRTIILALSLAGLTFAQICDPKLIAKADRPANERCGGRGTLANTKAVKRYNIGSTYDNTLAGCAKYCLGTRNCVFFTLDTRKNVAPYQCQVYKGTGAVMGAVNNASSPLHLYVSLTDR